MLSFSSEVETVQGFIEIYGEDITLGTLLEYLKEQEEIHGGE